MLSQISNKIILLVALFCTIISCIDEKEKCEDEILSTKHFETEFGCTNTRFDLQIDLHNEYTIIRSKSTYDTNVIGTCHPDIDFSKYDLVIGRQSTGNFNDTILYDYRRVCPNMDLSLIINVIQLDITMPSTVTYHALIPKLGDEESLNIQIIVI